MRPWLRLSAQFILAVELWWTSVAEAERCDSSRAGDVAAALARGALLGARGNSGVILSQFIRGFAAGVRDHDHVTAAALAAALQEAADAAYRTIPEPVEGTILTVAREAGRAASTAASDADAGVPGVIAAAAAGAKAAVIKTPSQLQIPIRPSSITGTPRCACGRSAPPQSPVCRSPAGRCARSPAPPRNTW